MKALTLLLVLALTMAIAPAAFADSGIDVGLSAASPQYNDCRAHTNAQDCEADTIDKALACDRATGGSHYCVWGSYSDGCDCGRTYTVNEILEIL